VGVYSSGKDRYGRMIDHITATGTGVNHEMVAAGMAWHYEKYDHSADLRDAEEAARAADRGLLFLNGVHIHGGAIQTLSKTLCAGLITG